MIRLFVSSPLTLARRMCPIGGIHMKKLIAIIVSASLGLSACATAPANISAVYVSPLQYQSYDCAQVRSELARVQVRVAEVTGKQQQQANNDALAMGVGLIVFWPALFLLALSDDHKAELGRLKGEYDALQAVYNEKRCSAQP